MSVDIIKVRVIVGSWLMHCKVVFPEMAKWHALPNSLAF